MTRIAEKIYEQALDLPIEDRLALIDKLLHSANLPTSTEIDQLWIREVKRRCRDVDEGKSNIIQGEDVFRKIEKKYS